MAASPICIVTSSGMICDSASFEIHNCGAEDCHIEHRHGPRGKKRKALKVGDRVKLLMARAGVGDGDQFIIFTRPGLRRRR